MIFNVEKILIPGYLKINNKVIFSVEKILISGYLKINYKVSPIANKIEQTLANNM